MSLLGASLAVEHRAHFGFDQVTKGLPSRAKRAVETFAGAVVLMFALLVVATGIALMDLTMGERSPALNLPVALVYAAVPVSGALMVIHMLAGRAGWGGGAPMPAVPEQLGLTGDSDPPSEAGARHHSSEDTT